MCIYLCIYSVSLLPPLEERSILKVLRQTHVQCCVGSGKFECECAIQVEYAHVCTYACVCVRACGCVGKANNCNRPSPRVGPGPRPRHGSRFSSQRTYRAVCRLIVVAVAFITPHTALVCVLVCVWVSAVIGSRLSRSTAQQVQGQRLKGSKCSCSAPLCLSLSLPACFGLCVCA